MCCTNQYLIKTDNYYPIITLHALFISTTLISCSLFKTEFSVSSVLRQKCLLTQQFFLGGKHQLHNIIKRMSGQDVSVREKISRKSIFHELTPRRKMRCSRVPRGFWALIVSVRNMWSKFHVLFPRSHIQNAATSFVLFFWTWCTFGVRSEVIPPC